MEALLENRIQGIDSDLAPDGGQAEDVRDRMLVSDGLSSANDLEPRTKRVFEETMTFILLAKGGRFEVEAASGNRYEAEIIAKFCTCPDWQQRTPDGGVNICIASITIKETNDNRYYWQWWEGHKMTFKYNSVNPDE